jgi:transcriptional regulator with XRE-family HTH domain
MLTTPREAGLLLRGLREDQSLTRAEVATKAGVSLRWLANFEHGKPSVDMSKALDCFQVLGYGFELTPLPWKAG